MYFNIKPYSSTYKTKLYSFVLIKTKLRETRYLKMTLNALKMAIKLFLGKETSDNYVRSQNSRTVTICEYFNSIFFYTDATISQFIQSITFGNHGSSLMYISCQPKFHLTLSPYVQHHGYQSKKEKCA
jgi:hypothetical protein